MFKFFFKIEFKFENYTNMNENDWSLFYHRLVEAFKHVYAKRSYFGDEDFVDMTKVRVSRIFLVVYFLFV